MTTTASPNNAHLTVAPWPGEDDGTEGRQQRGLAIAATTPYLKVPGGWLTPSQATPDVLYRLARDQDGSYCECPDYAQRGAACKHAIGLEYVLERDRLTETISAQLGGNHAGSSGRSATAVLERPAPAPVLEPLVIRERPELNPAPPAPTVPHSTLYNAAQENESAHFIRLLWDLVGTISQTPQGSGRTHGRNRADIQKVLYGLIHRVHTTKSGRRSYSDLKIASAVMGLGDLPPRQTLTRYMEDPLLTPILEHLVEISAVPLSLLETSFSADSTGFGTTIRDETWADARWGNKESRKAYTGSTWTKAHFMVGNYTNVITAVFVTPTLAKSGDSPQLKRLLAITARHFNIERVQADKAYISGPNLRAIVDEGARAEIPFKKDSIYRNPTAKNGKLWNRLLQYFRENEDEFYAGYHQRSNVESTNSGVKRLFDEITRSKHPVARVNEVLMKAAAYNITRVIHALYIDGIEPFFGE